jgi:prepilin peptidase CpaA
LRITAQQSPPSLYHAVLLASFLMIGFLFFLFGLLVTLGMCGLAAWSDYKGFRIPNLVSIIIIAAFGVAFGVTHLTGQSDAVFGSLKSHLIAAGAVLLITMLFFALRLLGAGDSKFATAIALWAGGPPGFTAFLFYMALLGGLLGLISLALKRWKPLKSPQPDTWPAKAQEGHNAVPYGIAIAAGAVIAFVIKGYFSPDTWAAMFNA